MKYCSVTKPHDFLLNLCQLIQVDLQLYRNGQILVSQSTFHEKNWIDNLTTITSIDALRSIY